MRYQRVGLHVSAAGGVENAPERAEEFGAECFQFFSRSPRGGAAPEITDEQAKLFKLRCKELGLESYIHTPYYINFASKKKSLAEGAPRIVREELERGSKLGVKYVMTHIGSAKDWRTPPSPPLSRGALIPAVSNDVLRQVVAGLKEIYKGSAKYSTKLLLEISAGSGDVVGSSFEELGYILKQLGRKDVYVCLDTCHMFASGYDFRSKETLAETMKQFRRQVGMSRFKLLHVNDSKAELGSHKDRHEHIGKGKIGDRGFRVILAHKDFQKVNFILETKHDEGIYNDLRFLKKYRHE